MASIRKEISINAAPEQVWDARRLAWSVVDGPYQHHNGVAKKTLEAD